MDTRVEYSGYGQRYKENVIAVVVVEGLGTFTAQAETHADARKGLIAQLTEKQALATAAIYDILAEPAPKTTFLD